MTGHIAPTHSRAMPLRQYLRGRTAAAHNELDASVGVLDTVDRYARYLEGQFRFRSGIEALLSREPFPDWFGGWRPLALTASLHADLAALGLPAPCGEPAGALARRLGTPPGMMGVLYVLEGAALGARYLYRSVRALGLTAETGARHLDLQAGSESWQGFLGLLGRSDIGRPDFGRPDFDREEAAEAAVATFAYARGAFTKDLHEGSG